MNFDLKILDELTAGAKLSPRLRMNRDLRNSPADSSQRMLNAVEPGTELPVHRHPFTSETVAVLRGRVVQHFYTSDGILEESVEMGPGLPVVGMSVEAGRWHRLESLESGSVILECKDGPYNPIGPEDILII